MIEKHIIFARVKTRRSGEGNDQSRRTHVLNLSEITVLVRLFIRVKTPSHQIGQEIDRRFEELDGVGERCLKEVGIRKGQIVLDFGCGSGNYTISAAVIVGKKGEVYAFDKERRGFWPSEGLDELIRRAESRRLGNIVVMETSGEPEIDLEDESVDIVLLYDVLPYYYFPKEEGRRELLREVYKITRTTRKTYADTLR